MNGAGAGAGADEATAGVKREGVLPGEESTSAVVKPTGDLGCQSVPGVGGMNADEASTEADDDDDDNGDDEGTVETGTEE